MAGGRRDLLDDDDDIEDDAPSLQLGFNENYAKRFEYNKKREDLHRLKELKNRGLAGDSSSDSSSSEEEDDDGLLPARTDEKIFETLTKIKKRDPSIYSAETKFFEDGEEDEEDDRQEVKKQKQKPLYLKDVNARQLLDGDTTEEESRKPKTPAPSYLTEQDELKRAFLQGVREAEGLADDGADDLLKVKHKSKEELERDALETEEAVGEAEQRAKDKGIAKRLEEYFGRDDDLDDNEKFLKEYLLNKGWIDHERQQKLRRNFGVELEDEDISEDEIALDQQDEFEKNYNFRFQEGENNYVKGHSRIINDSVRKKSDTRKKQRAKKRERELDEEHARREELKRLKNVKKKEVMEKLSKIRAVAGVDLVENPSVQILGEEDFDEDFDPDEYDKKMKEAFGEEYYGADDPDFVEGDDSFDVEKPIFSFDDKLSGIGTMESHFGGGFAATKVKLDQSSSVVNDVPEDTKKKKKKIKVPFEEKLLIDKHLQEYYKLDYEDVIGDLPTRFKYRSVKPNKFGLKTKDIINLEDKDLNQFVSLKKLAPYTSEEWQPRGRPPRFDSRGKKKRANRSKR